MPLGSGWFMIMGQSGLYGRVGEQSTGLNLSKSSPSPGFESTTTILFVDAAYLPKTTHDHGGRAAVGRPGERYGWTVTSTGGDAVRVLDT